ncbi:preprotein translocase subunit YajC [Sphingomonas sp. MG17]|jgi:preprotein translocase subunit YajC|uniref:Sec translocon accessory complex subunit YajC n=1 Tax=Sphingomonas tagetis TaxID=2949092 RepID=A0A9X2HDH6_9SPHN|nr:preprotein translocase subunit YajC [Sphingomonas tagetis]MCP3728828.1 preprotein translocase subunit YajC [Sphingomonas tagetis]
MIISPAYAQAAGGAAQASPMGGIMGILPLVLIFVAFYFLMIRPQQKRMKTLQASIASIKKNDTVVTAGGLVGKVVSVDDVYAQVEIAPTVKVKVVKATIVEVQPLGGKPAND